MNFWRPSWRHIWRPVFSYRLYIFGYHLGGIFGDLAISLATTMMKRHGGPDTAAASCRSGTKNYTANFGCLRILPSKFQVNRLEIAACSVEQTHKQTHTHTHKEHFELKVKSHYVRQLVGLLTRVSRKSYV